MDYRLKVKKKQSPNFLDADLFEDLSINFDLDFYNVDNIDKLRVPVNINLSLPLTDNNASIIDYDPRGNVYTTIPNEAFDFQLFLNNTMVLRGNLYVDNLSFNNTTPVVEIRLVDRLQEVFSKSQELSFADLYKDKNSSLNFSNFLFAEQGVIGSMPVTIGGNKDIVFPYVDMCNDTQKFGYAARQFLQYGYDQEKTGLLPSFNIPNFIERFFTEAGVNVTSRFFKLGNYGTGVTGVDSEDMYMLVPSRIGAVGERSDQRTFLLREGRYNWYHSDFTEDAEFGVSSAKELPNYPQITIGWNQASSDSELDGKFGYIRRSTFPNTYTDIDKAFFAPHMSFNASPTGSARTLTSNHWIALDVPMVSLTTTNFAKVVGINANSSSAVFRVKAVVWKDGSKWESFYMMDGTTNEIKELNASDATVRDTIDNVLFAGAYQGGFTQIQDYDHQTVLEFDSNTVGSFYWEDKEVTFDAGSMYSYSLEFQMVSGSLNIEHAVDYIPDPANTGYVIYNNTATADFKDFQITKAIYREKTSSAGELFIAFEETSNSAPYFDDDVINLYASFRDNIDTLPYDIIKELINRFNLSVVYDQNTDSVIIDRLPDIRSQNQSVDVTGITDDAEQISVDINRQSLRKIHYVAPSGLFFDELGSGSLVVNEYGNEDIKYDLASRVYNRSLCGDFVFNEINSSISEYELGFTENQFTKNSDIGIVIAYMDVPQFTTNIRRGKFAVRGDYSGILYHTYNTHVFGGRLVSSKPDTISLNHIDNVGETTDLYDFCVGNDNIVFLSNPKISFKALMPKDYAFNIKDNYSLVDMNLIDNNNLIIKSVKGTMYDSGIYADIEAIIL